MLSNKNSTMKPISFKEFKPFLLIIIFFIVLKIIYSYKLGFYACMKEIQWDIILIVLILIFIKISNNRYKNKGE